MNNHMFQERYEVIKHIGQGGMADVYVAFDTVLKREVAIKVLRGELSKDPLALLRFKREAHAASKLNHPNIIEIYDVGEENNNYFIVMEYIKGKTLKQLILSRGALLKQEAVSIMKQLVSGVQHAHKQGVIHRDLKPQNIIVKDDGTIKILDFGIALAQDALQLTQSDSVMGSVHYLAPELAKGENASVQSDIYALGIVFYELLIGDVPFRGEQMVQIALQHINEELPQVREVNPSIPQSVANIITKTTAKNKIYRYRTTMELMNDLDVCLSQDRRNAAPIKLNFNDDENHLTKVIDKSIAKSPEIRETVVKSQPKQKSSDKKNRKLFGILGFFLSFMAIVVTITILYLSGIFDFGNKTVTIPNIINQSYDDAKIMIEELGLSIDSSSIERVLTKDTTKGLIVDVKPGVNETVKIGSQVKIVISNGIYEVMNDYVGKSIEEARSALSKYEKMRIIETTETSDTVAAGTIIRQELLNPNDEFDPNKPTDVRFVYAAYKTVVIPHHLIGMDVSSAKSELESMGVEVILSVIDTTTMTEEEKEKLDYGTVIKLSPTNGVSYTQTVGSYVTIFYY